MAKWSEKWTSIIGIREDNKVLESTNENKEFIYRIGCEFTLHSFKSKEKRRKPDLIFFNSKRGD